MRCGAGFPGTLNPVLSLSDASLVPSRGLNDIVTASAESVHEKRKIFVRYPAISISLGHSHYILRSTDPDRHIFALSEGKK